MHLARIEGTCVATQSDPALHGQRLLVLQPLTFELTPEGHHVIAVDTVGANRGELVWFVRSREAANALAAPFTPVDAAVVGIVDELTMEGRPVPTPEGASPSPPKGTTTTQPEVDA